MLLGASVVVMNEGKVLLTKREDFEMWCLPGGMMDEGESLEEAALREVREETGLEVELERFVGMYSAPKLMPGGSHTAVFVGRRVGGELRHDPKETLEVGYFSPEELPEPMLWWHREYVADALAGIGGSVVRKQDVTCSEDEISFEGLRDRLEQGEIALDTVQSWLVRQPTGES